MAAEQMRDDSSSGSQGERMRLLRMLQEGKITADEAARLLEAIDKDARPRASGVPGRIGRSLRIKVQEAGTEKVNIAVPLALARVALKFLPRSALRRAERAGVSAEDIQQLVSSAAGCAPCRILDVEDGNEKVEIYIE